MSAGLKITDQGIDLIAPWKGYLGHYSHFPFVCESFLMWFIGFEGTGLLPQHRTQAWAIYHRRQKCINTGSCVVVMLLGEWTLRCPFGGP